MIHVAEPRVDAALNLIRASGDHALTVGPTAPVGATMAMLADSETAILDQWLAEEAWLNPAADAKAMAALLIGRLSWVVMDILVPFHLHGLIPVAMRPDALILTLRRGRWDYAGKSGAMLHIDPHLNLSRITFGGPGYQTITFRALIETMHAPVIAELHRRSKLPKAALWRLVADSVAYAFLEMGKQTGQAGAAMAQAVAILSEKSCALHNKQTGFIQITLPADTTPELAQSCDWFRVRGGCCRYYTLPGEDYCSTCVLRSTESRNALLRDHLKQQVPAS